MGVIAGLISITGSLVAPVADTLRLALGADGACVVETRPGFSELSMSMLCVVLGVSVMRAQGRWPGVLLIATTLLAMIIASSFVAMCMLFALVGGVLATIPHRRRAIVTQVLSGGHLGHTKLRH